MTTEHPLPDRCGARVTNKTGLEVKFESTEPGSPQLTDETIGSIRLLADDFETDIDSVPVYYKLREYLWDDYTATHVALPAGETLPDDVDDYCYSVDAPLEADATVESPDRDGDWYELENVVKVTNRTSELVGFCERYPMDCGRCYDHKGPGAKKGNTNAMTHGLHAQETNFYSALDDEGKHFIESMVDTWIEMSPYERDNPAVVNDLYRCAIDQLRLWAGIEEYEEDGDIVGLTKEVTIDYDPDKKEEITAEDGNPVNLEYSRLDQDVQSKLKTLDVYGMEEEQTEATMSLAKKLSGLDE